MDELSLGDVVAVDRQRTTGRAVLGSSWARLAPGENTCTTTTTTREGPAEPKATRSHVDDDGLMGLVWEPVICWLHRNELEESEFLAVELAEDWSKYLFCPSSPRATQSCYTSTSTTLELSTEHLVYSRDRDAYVRAGALRAEESVLEVVEVEDQDYHDSSLSRSPSSSTYRRVRSATSVKRRGYYCPQTPSGTLLVDDVRCSCYAVPERYEKMYEHLWRFTNPHSCCHTCMLQIIAIAASLSLVKVIAAKIIWVGFFSSPSPVMLPWIKAVEAFGSYQYKGLNVLKHQHQPLPIQLVMLGPGGLLQLGMLATSSVAGSILL
eukprot:g11305.t1